MQNTKMIPWHTVSTPPHSVLLQGWHTELDVFCSLGFHSSPTLCGKMNNCKKKLLIFKHTKNFFLRTAHISVFIVSQAQTGSLLHDCISFLHSSMGESSHGGAKTK